MKSALLVLVSLWLPYAAFSAPFINLDFEAINTNAIPGYPFPQGRVTRAMVLPGWVYYGDTSGTNGINFNSDCTDTYCGSFITQEAFDPQLTDTTLAYHYFPNGLHGNYGLGFAPQPNFPATLSQRGDVPPEANYIAVDAQISRSAVLNVALDNTVVVIQTEHQNRVMDITAFAGKTVDLEIKCFSTNLRSGIAPAVPPIPSTIGLDGIAFLHLATPSLNTTNAHLSTNGFTFSWQADPASRFQPQFTTNLPPAWQAIGSVVTSTNGNFTFTDTTVATNKTVAQRFYRLRSLPP